MRRKFVLGLSLTGLFSGSAFGQFASDRFPLQPGALPSVPTSPVSPLPRGYQPVQPGSPGAYTPPVGAYNPSRDVPPPVPATPPPMDTAVYSALPADHPWLLKAEHGEFFICVKSYSRPSRATPGDNGPSARELAEALAGEIRDTYRVQAFLYEYISEERRAEMAAVAAARQRAQVFASQWEAQKQKSQLQGMEFLEPDHKVRFKTVNYRDQIAVLIGGFRTDEDARKALDRVRAYPAPKTRVRETSLMDWGSVVRPGPDGKPVLEQSHINPYHTATVVPNPAVVKGIQSGGGGLDPLLVELNKDRPYSLLKATKPWTLGVKSFSAPVEIVGRDGDNNVMRKHNSGKGADALKASAEQAEALAKTLREMKCSWNQGKGLEAFVFHNRSGSIVTVGQFDGPNDPALLQLRQVISSLEFRVTEDKDGFRPAMTGTSVFGNNLIPIPVPRP